MGRDYTLFSMIDGQVKFEAVSRDRKQVSVYPSLTTQLSSVTEDAAAVAD
jgi:large subunit ribosomal protein L27